ncbi:nitronate monooxygenase [Metabacillus idriensis]|uniref:NAD(P)H-dependent flavin oxidoreductase n=1 Tax=Metabacillus idriensis TaxID=324768 RepID=UPI002813AF87|nr:nitronate monooxygenase [Metabacillus idriensis]MDR0140027.1 nitronate monooxygenase [Metabacillus idriensis]
MTWHHTSLSRLLKIEYPIVQAPMAGGITVPKLVSEVSEAGALGSVGAGYLTSVQLDQHIKEIKALTSRPFNVNLFVPEKEVSISKEDIQTMTGILKKMNMPVHDVSFTNETSYSNYEKQLEAVLLNDVPICSFTFGLPSIEAVRELKQAGRIVIGTATTVEEAILFEERGADVIVMQGSEAGGHRGTFNDSADACIGTMALVPQAADALCVPVIAAGGIADARGIAAALILGADGVQLGSVFIPCTESGAPAAYKAKILSSKEDETVLTRAFSGKYARGISNDFIQKMKPFENSILPYPVQNELTKRLRSHAAKELNAENMSLWAGQSLRLINESMSAKEVLDRLIAGVNDVTESSRKDVNASGS